MRATRAPVGGGGASGVIFHHGAAIFWNNDAHRTVDTVAEPGGQRTQHAVHATMC